MDEQHKQKRLGKVTASKVFNLFGTPAARSKYMRDLLAERITGIKEDSFESSFMKWGNEFEPIARLEYSMKYCLKVKEVDFVAHPKINDSGCSPDGLIEEEGLIEIKCRQSNTHLDYFLTGKPTKDDIHQMIWQMACTGRHWCDLVAYHPYFPEHLKMVVIKLDRNMDSIKIYEDKVVEFLAELEDLYLKILKRGDI